MILRALRPDAFMLGIVGALLVALFFPASASVAEPLNISIAIGIAALFFLYGARLAPREALDGLKNWRLHSLILTFTFIVFPIIGLALKLLTSNLIGNELATGLLFLTLVPSTVQSSITFTSLARGNVAGAMVSASASNLLGVFLTPLLVMALITTTSPLGFSGSAIGTIVLQLLAPFILGQLCRPLLSKFLTQHATHTKHFDRFTILLVVYAAFSSGMREHIWSKIQWYQLIELIVISLIVVIIMLWLTWTTAKKLLFSRADAIAIQFCGTKKSLATGLPMAAIIFSEQPIGLIVLPLMIFHQIQLMICAALAAHYSRQD